MNYLYNQFPNIPKQFCICDAIIDMIVLEENSVCFVFNKGFFVIEDGIVKETSSGYVEFRDCNSDEFICHIIEREATPVGAKLYGKPVLLEDLADLLSKKDRKIEVYLELYEYDYMHWRGALLPYKDEGLSDNVIIETSGSYPVTCNWEMN